VGHGKREGMAVAAFAFQSFTLFEQIYGNDCLLWE